LRPTTSTLRRGIAIFRPRESQARSRLDQRVRRVRRDDP
jgi:hypothetical protein